MTARLRTWGPQDECDRQYEHAPANDRPPTPPSPMSRTPLAASPAVAGPDKGPVVDLEFLVATGFLPASKLKEN